MCVSNAFHDFMEKTIKNLLFIMKNSKMTGMRKAV